MGSDPFDPKMNRGVLPKDYQRCVVCGLTRKVSDLTEAWQAGDGSDPVLVGLSCVDGCEPAHREAEAAKKDEILSRAEKAEARVVELEAMLRDPEAVRANLLRGTIASPPGLAWLGDSDGPVAELRQRAEKTERERDKARGELEREMNAHAGTAAAHAALKAERDAWEASVRNLFDRAGLSSDAPQLAREVEVMLDNRERDLNEAEDRAEKAERERDAARAEVSQLRATISILCDALAATPAPTHDYSGLCAAPSCEGHCGYAHARGCEAVREYLTDHGGEPYRAPSKAVTRG